MTDKSQNLTKTEQLIGQLAWEALKAIKGLCPDPATVAPIKYPDLVKHMIDNLAEYPFGSWDYALQMSTKGIPYWRNYLGSAGTILVDVGYKTGPKGYWEITEEGEQFIKDYVRKGTEATEKLGLAWRGYTRRKRLERISKSVATSTDSDDEGESGANATDEDQIRGDIVGHIEQLHHNEFERLVEYLFVGMGYTTYLTPKGRDDGIDIIAHKDLLGAEGLIIKIQVKHTENTKKTASTGLPEVQRLNGICTENNSHGVFVSAKGFVRGVQRDVRTGSLSNVSLIDLSRFIDLWIEHIDTIPQAGKNMLPLKQIFVLDD